MLNYWTKTCKFKIDKKTYSKLQFRTTCDVGKNKQLYGVYCILNISTPPFHLDLLVKNVLLFVARKLFFFWIAYVSHCSKITNLYVPYDCGHQGNSESKIIAEKHFFYSVCELLLQLNNPEDSCHSRILKQAHWGIPSYVLY